MKEWKGEDEIDKERDRNERRDEQWMREWKIIKKGRKKEYKVEKK